MFNTELMLTPDFLADEFGLNLRLSSEQTKSKIKQYYLITCELIQKCHYLEPSPDEIEEYISTGAVTVRGQLLACPIKDREDRIRLFLTAQAKQLAYDYTSGRGAMFRGEDGKYDTCRDVVSLIKLLGLYQRTVTCQ